MFRHKRLVGALTVGAVCGLVGVVGVLPAVGKSSPPSSPIILGGSAVILARGAAARPFVYVACQPGSYTELRLSLSERSGKGIASGKGRVEQIPCNGQIETITIPVTAKGRPFVPGTAFAKASFTSCYYSCGNATVSHNVKLKAKHK